MTTSDLYREKFDRHCACVIIPTYNNAATLKNVIADVAGYSDHIIVVNDGSTDITDAIVQEFPFVQYISYPQNIGKGWALRKAFAYALEQDYKFAITIDSDGQHFAKDIPLFIDRLEEEQGAIIMGARNMDQASVPGKSSFGHKFSNFWFRVETGIRCPDTQTGFRLYPLYLLKDLRFFTRKYEFEIEVLVRAAWKGVKVQSVPVSVYYAPKEVRVSHFRPFKDFTRISLLNTCLVFITFLYIKPRDFIRGLFSKKKIKEVIREQLFNPRHSDQLKAISVAFGVFMGIVPIWGFQLVVAIFLCILLRLNKALVIIAANISIPPMIPVIIFLSYKTGALWMQGRETSLVFSRALSLDAVRNNLEQYIYGSCTLAVIAGALAGLLTLLFIKLFKKRAILAA